MGAIEESIDLGVIVCPIGAVEKVTKQCADQGIKNVIVMTDFPTSYRGEITKEIKSLCDVAQYRKVRLLGPNVSALIRSSSKLNLSLTENTILPGKLALVSRSSAICNSVIDWAETEQVGFSSIISHGAGVDVDLADILDFLSSDYRTNSIVLYINHIHNSRRFMSALRAAAKIKPVIVLKSAHENGSYSDVVTKIPNVHVMHDIFLAAVLRAGADNVSSLSNLFAAAKILGSSQQTRGERLGIVSNGYGPVMLANDRLRDLGISTHKLSPELATELKSTADGLLSFENAIMISDRKDLAALYAENVKRLLASSEIDAVAIFLAPSAMIDAEAIAFEVAKVLKRAQKPVLAVWLGSNTAGKGRQALIKEKISNYRTPESAMEAFSFLCHHFANRQRLLQVPFALKKTQPPALDQSRTLIKKSLDNKENVLSKEDTQRLLEAFHVKCDFSEKANNAQSVSLGRPLKLAILNDPVFGPVISLGFGGALSSALKNSAIQLPPLNRRLSENLINDAEISTVLDKYHNVVPLNRGELRDVLMRVSEISTQLPEVFELTLDPLMLGESDAVVGDAQVVVQKVDKDHKLFSHLAIHPYPSDWHRHIVIQDDQKVEVRPIRAEDAKAEVKFIDNMSKESKYFRFMYVVNTLTPEMLSNFTKLDYDREMAFGAFMQKDGEDILLGESRYAINPDKKSCEFSIVVDDNFQGMGLARQLMLILIEHIKDHDLQIIEGTVLKKNMAMDKLMMSLGFTKRASPEDYDINIYTLKYDD